MAQGYKGLICMTIVTKGLGSNALATTGYAFGQFGVFDILPTYNVYKNLLIELKKMMLDFVIAPTEDPITNEVEEVERNQFKFSKVLIGNRKIDLPPPYMVIYIPGNRARFQEIGNVPQHDIEIELIIGVKLSPETEFLEKLRIYGYLNDKFIENPTSTLLNGTADLMIQPPEVKLEVAAKAGVTEFSVTMAFQQHRVS